MSSSLDQKGPSPHLLVSEPEPQLPPMTSADDVTRASSSSSSGCQLGSLLVLAEATSQFVQSSRVDGQLPGGFGQLSLQASASAAVHSHYTHFHRYFISSNRS